MVSLLVCSLFNKYCFSFAFKCLCSFLIHVQSVFRNLLRDYNEIYYVGENGGERLNELSYQTKISCLLYYTVTAYYKVVRFALKIIRSFSVKSYTNVIYKNLPVSPILEVVHLLKGIFAESENVRGVFACLVGGVFLFVFVIHILCNRRKVLCWKFIIVNCT